jgi:hypothetical protein
MVERVVNVFPQLQVTLISLYFGCVSIFMLRLPSICRTLALRAARAWRATAIRAEGNPQLCAIVRLPAS